MLKLRSNMVVDVSAKKVLISLLTVSSLLFVGHFLARYIINNVYLDPGSVRYALLHEFSLETDISIATWFSQAALLVAGGVLFFIGLLTRAIKQPYPYHWMILGIIFIYLSIDETVSIHELAVGPVRDALGITGGYFFFAWIIPALVLLVLLSLIFLKFWLSLPKATKRLLLISAVIYIGGAAGFEAIGAQLYTSVEGQPVVTDTLSVLFALEEFMEMIGVVVFIYALLKYTEQQNGDKPVKLYFKQ